MLRPLAAHARCYRAARLEQALGTPAHIYYKNEGVSPPGSHKPNTAVPQAYYNKQFGIKRLTTETGAGQWGSALALACSLFGLECKVYMVRISFDQKPFRKLMMQTWGAECVASPSPETNAGRDDPGQDARHARQPRHRHQRGRRGGRHRSKDTRYSLGSVLNHVLLHQTIIGLEAKKQLKLAGEIPGRRHRLRRRRQSNFAGIAFPFVADKIHGKKMRHHRRRAGRLPDADARAVRLRLRRHGA